MMNEDRIYCKRRNGNFRLERLPLPMCYECKDISCVVKIAILSETADEHESRPKYKRKRARVYQDHE